MEEGGEVMSVFYCILYWYRRRILIDIVVVVRCIVYCEIELVLNLLIYCLFKESVYIFLEWFILVFKFFGCYYFEW